MEQICEVYVKKKIKIKLNLNQKCHFLLKNNRCDCFCHQGLFIVTLGTGAGKERLNYS